MKFSEYEYKRLDIEKIQIEFSTLLDTFKKADSAKKQLNTFYEINDLRKNIRTMFSIVFVRYSVDTNDKFYDDEQKYIDEIAPLIDEFEVDLGNTILESKFRSELEAELGILLFRKAENNKKSFKPEIIPEMQEENKLVSEYHKLKASASIPFKGEDRNLAQLIPYMQDPDRETRKEASELFSGFMSTHMEELDNIFDKLVKLRTGIAKKLGFDSFLELGYIRMERLDYDEKMVANFRKQVLEEIVPLTVKLRERQQKRLGLENLYNYDENFNFKSGNPLPKGDSKWIIEQGKKMYSELSPETDEFFSFMSENELLDLETRKGKLMAGFCKSFPDHKAPYIFSNFNGTEGDINVLTHEAGHAFQNYCCRDFNVMDYISPSSESCEIHSISMEFLTWPWMNLFFGDDTEKFRFSHLSKALLSIPYGVAVDEFQHYVYKNASDTPEQRRAKWREIEKKYLPNRTYDNNQYLEDGGRWQIQMHIYVVPFYFIDYSLAQICAFQFFKISREAPDKAWEDYLKLCKKGGSDSFLGLLKSANLESPLKDGTVKNIVGVINDTLDNIDDSQF